MCVCVCARARAGLRLPVCVCARAPVGGVEVEDKEEVALLRHNHLVPLVLEAHVPVCVCV